jgi:hypothetical protein
MCCPEAIPLPREEYDLFAIIQTSFERNLDIFQNFENIVISYGQHQKAWGEFDTRFFGRVFAERFSEPVVNTLVVPPLDTHRFRRAKGVDIAIEKKFASGIFVRPTVRIERVSDNFLGPLYQTAGRAFVDIEIPFLRGSGYLNAAAEVISTRYQYEADASLWRFQVSEILSGIAISYWNYNFDRERIEIFKESIELSERILAGLLEMVDAGELTRADIPQVRGDIATKKELLIRAEQQLFSDKLFLAVLMNIDPSQEFRITRASYYFPGAEEVDILGGEVDGWIRSALDNRADYLALTLNEKATHALLRRALNDMKPTVNLQMGVGVSGLDTQGRFFNSLSSRVKGADWRAAAVVETPICYSFEKGNLNEKRGEFLKAKAATLELNNTIVADVQVLISALQNHVLQKAELERAVKEQEMALEDELFKFREGLSSVFNIVQRTDRLLTAQLQLIDEMKRFLSDIIFFRLKTGLIVPIYGCINGLTEASFITLPTTYSHYPKSVNFGCAKTPRLNDHKLVNIN